MWIEWAGPWSYWTQKEMQTNTLNVYWAGRVGLGIKNKEIFRKWAGPLGLHIKFFFF